MTETRKSDIPSLTVAELAAIRWLVAHEQEMRSEYGCINVYSLRRYYRRNGPARGWRGASGRAGAASTMYDRLAGKGLVGGGEITDVGRKAAR